MVFMNLPLSNVLRWPDYNGSATPTKKAGAVPAFLQAERFTAS
jgi:hypothetical protein